MSWLEKSRKTLAGGLANLSPSCREASRLQSEALDRPLSFRRRLGLRIHLLLCKWCRRYGRQLTFLRRAAREHPDEIVESLPQTLSVEARERIKRRLRSGSD
jgi:hypothetical protein